MRLNGMAIALALLLKSSHPINLKSAEITKKSVDQKSEELARAVFDAPSRLWKCYGEFTT
jgi:hypothetical protein